MKPTPLIHQHIRRAPTHSASRAAAARILPDDMMTAAYNSISHWHGYAPTPLHPLSDFAAQHKLGQVLYKDESPRFGLDSFKALGGAYAVQVLKEQHNGSASLTVATATDGNHGRSVAWGAQRAGCQSRVFVHRHVSDERVAAIAAQGAEVIRINGNYDDSVRACSDTAAEHGWHIVSDTSWDGYTKTPTLVMAGYTVIMREIQQQLHQQLHGTTPTHIILQAGVGAFAAAMIAAWLADDSNNSNTLPRCIIVESQHADCLLQSAAADRIVHTPVNVETMMAGLSCGEPSLLAWDVLAAAASDFISISDDGIADALRDLYRAGINAGECSTAGIALLAGASDAQRAALGLDDDSVVLLFGSEGATDQENIRRLLDN